MLKPCNIEKQDLVTGTVVTSNRRIVPITRLVELLPTVGDHYHLRTAQLKPLMPSKSALAANWGSAWTRCFPDTLKSSEAGSASQLAATAFLQGSLRASKKMEQEPPKSIPQGSVPEIHSPQTNRAPQRPEIRLNNIGLVYTIGFDLGTIAARQAGHLLRIEGFSLNEPEITPNLS